MGPFCLQDWVFGFERLFQFRFGHFHFDSVWVGAGVVGHRQCWQVQVAAGGAGGLQEQPSLAPPYMHIS